ncbi:hypothetical protein M569_09519 [Genlisea aurea]|uniref:Late embryogenesis abundant protein LEA-2 subgroup domain-containing protein n=1 Tax=Genlisea aurea TaxID=192259 RepID=S8DYY1_9LAMI|nr:hypothetical protein M569_09519 [Genlisea aurea]
METEEAALNGARKLEVERNLRRRRRTRCICLSIVAVILFLVILILILSLTVLKPKRPTTKVESVSIENLLLDLNGPQLNLTLGLVVSLYNPNRVGFSFSNGTALVKYRGNEVGVAPIPAGSIGSRDSISMNLTLTVMLNRLFSNSSTLLNDFLGGVIPLETYVRLKGKVRIVFVIHVVATAVCDLQINLASRSVGGQSCQYETKL